MRVGQHVQHGGRREVADAGEAVAGRLQRLVRQPGRARDRVEHLGTTGVGDPAGDVLGLEVVVAEEVVEVVAEVGLHDVGDAGVEHDPEAAAADVPAHHPLGVRVEAAAGVDHAGTRGRRRRPVPVRPSAAARRSPTITTAAAPSPNSPLATRFAMLASSRWMVSEHSSTDEQHRDAVGVAAQVVVQPGDAGRAGDAAQPEDRQPLDVGAQPEARHEPRLDARGGDAGHRGGDDEVDVGGGQAGRGQGRGDGLVDRARPPPR